MRKKKIQNPFEISDILASHRNQHKTSERKLAEFYGIPKTVVHRLLKLANIPTIMRDAYTNHSTDIYIFYDFISLPVNTEDDKHMKDSIKQYIIDGKIKIRRDLRNYIEKYKTDLVRENRTTLNLLGLNRPF